MCNSSQEICRRVFKEIVLLLTGRIAKRLKELDLDKPILSLCELIHNSKQKATASHRQPLKPLVSNDEPPCQVECKICIFSKWDVL